MPVPVRRKLLVLSGILLAGLVTAGVAAAANGGFTPEAPHSPNAQRISSAYYLILALTAVIFVIVETALVVFVVKYRSRGRGREVEGAQVHGHTRLELLWTAGPVVILAVIATFVFVKLPGIANIPKASAADRVDITVEGHQFYWLFRYPNGAVSINDLHVPVNTVVDLTVISPDVIHSWWIPQLGGKIQAIPGRTNHTWFEANKTGVYQGQCAELCGVYHSAMLAKVTAEPAADYRRYISSTAAATLGQQEFEGSCATCHGMHGEGGYGPVLTSSLVLKQYSALASRVRNGGVLMPAVGDTWTEAQIKALYAYVSTHVYKGAASGG